MSTGKISASSINSGDIFKRQFPLANCRIMLSERTAPWREKVVARLDHICRLPAGWDGYDGQPVDFSAANFALKILESVCEADTPAPSIVPGTSGDLQIEWHTSKWDLEIDVAGPYRVEVWRRNALSAAEDELTPTIDFTEVRRWVSQIAEPMVALRSAAA